MSDRMSTEDALLTLAAKTAMLERLVRLLLWDRLTEKDDPTQMATDLAESMISETESRIGVAGSPAELLAVENLQMFFDQLIHEVSQWPPRSMQRPNP